jgi:hypothetical protein
MFRPLRSALVAACLITIAACSGGGDDDDDDGASRRERDGGGSTTTSGAVPEAQLYDATARDAFVGACTANGNSEDDCRCTIDRIAATLPFEDFVAFEQRLGTDPDTPPPPQLAAATEHCLDA